MTRAIVPMAATGRVVNETGHAGADGYGISHGVITVPKEGIHQARHVL
jgi:hypothetical protein